MAMPIQTSYWGVEDGQNNLYHVEAAWSQVVLDVGDLIYFIPSHQNIPGTVLCSINNSPVYPVLMPDGSAPIPGMIQPGFTCILQFTGLTFILTTPAPVATPAAPPAPGVPAPQLKINSPPVNVTLFPQGYIEAPTQTVYQTLSNQATGIINVAMDANAQAYGIYEVTVSVSSSGDITFLPNNTGPAVDLGTQTLFSFLCSTATTNKQAGGFLWSDTTTIWSNLGTLIFQTPVTGVVSVRRVI